MRELCACCATWKKSHEQENPLPEVPDHCCLKNHEGTSGFMEPKACVAIVTRLHDEFNTDVKMTCMDDDDSSARSALQWSNADYLKNNNTTELLTVPMTRGINKGDPQPCPDKGKLKGTIPEPSCCSDPNHRKKILTGDVCAMATKKKSENFTMAKMDMNRVGKNFACMIRSLPKMDPAKHEDAGRAALLHHFDDHTFCGEWHPRKKLSSEAKKDSQQHCCSKVKDAKSFEVLNKIMERFITGV